MSGALVGRLLAVPRYRGDTPQPIDYRTVSGWERGSIPGGVEGETSAEERARYERLERELMRLALDRSGLPAGYAAGDLVRAWEVAVRARSRLPIRMDSDIVHRQRMGTPLEELRCELEESKVGRIHHSGTGSSSEALFPGEVVIVTLRIRNTGRCTWWSFLPSMTDWDAGARGPMLVGTTRPRDRRGWLHDPTEWPLVNRPCLLEGQAVLPGGVGVFRFHGLAPSAPGEYCETYGLVVEGYSWVESPDVAITFWVGGHE